METLEFEIEIVAPVQTVWSTMLDEDSYRQWTSSFSEGSYYTGDWERGSTIRFLGPDISDAGTESDGGMLGTVVESRPLEFVQVEYSGLVANGVDDTTSDEARKIAGTHEGYRFSENNGVTTVVVRIEVLDEWAQMFRDMWPAALDRLRDLAERADAPNRERLGADN
jgi:uncharacterized protein YndB with AHSA1/START domain